jgi:hypothetical protein
MSICRLYVSVAPLPFYFHTDDFQLIPPTGTDLQMHLQSLTESGLSTAKFEQCVSDFLEGLLFGQPMPTLAQVESGKIDGLSRRDARGLQVAVGMASI